MGGAMQGFKKFLLRRNLIELAVAVVIGAAFGTLIKDFVTSFIAPLIALLGGQPDFTDLSFTINDTKFPYGVFLTSAIAFVIVALIIYFFVVLPVATLLERMTKAEEASERDCPQC